MIESGRQINLRRLWMCFWFVCFPNAEFKIEGMYMRGSMGP